MASDAKPLELSRYCVPFTPFKAKLEDVHEWFKTYYGPANAVIVIAGDIDAQTARQKVERFFAIFDDAQVDSIEVIV